MKRAHAAFWWMAIAALGMDARAEETAVMLRVKPLLCITDNRAQDCEARFLVQWASNDVGDYCLSDDTSHLPLHCWQQETSGQFDERRTVIGSFSYWLTLSGQERPLAEARVELMTIESPERRRNRRNRHAWSIL